MKTLGVEQFLTKKFKLLNKAFFKEQEEIDLE
jgi:hypothetical protein